MEAQYSIPYCAAVALAGDPADPREFNSTSITDAARREFASRVELRVDAECEAVYPARFGSRIQLHLANGEVKEAATLDPHGTAADPCSDAEIIAKFRRLAAYSENQIDVAAVVQAVADIDRSGSVRELTALLRV
jgi:2-methylcitrate dehydratase PrpD